MSFFKPPLGAGIDWSHPLAQQLEAMWLMNEATGNKLFDVTRHGNDGTLTAMADDDWSTTPRGSALDFDANTKYVEVTKTARLSTMDELTVFSLVKVNGEPGGSFGRIVHKSNGVTSDDYALILTPTSLLGRLRIVTSSTTEAVGAKAMSIGSIFALVGTWRGSDGSMHLYTIDQNGEVDVATGTQAGNLADTAANLAIGRHLNSSARNFNGEVIVAGISRRKWSQAEAEWFASEPYAMISEVELQRAFSITAVKGVGPFTELSVMATPGMIHAFTAKDPAGAAAEVFFENRHPIEHGMKPQTAAGLGGVLID